MRNNEKMCHVIKKIITNSHASSLVDLKINNDLQVFLLCPTYDLFLTKQQYVALWQFLDLIGETKCYLTQFDNVESGINSEENTFLCIHKDMTYEEYLNINLYSLSLLISENGNWAIFIEETLEDGIGIIVAEKKYADKFKLCYPQVSKDILYYKEECGKVENFTSSQYYVKLMKLLNRN